MSTFQTILVAIASAAVGYMLGAIPTAWLVMRRALGRDIRSEGSHNVGTRNFYEVSGSKWLSVIVLLGDALKGAAAVWFGMFISPDDFLGAGVAAFFAVAGHNYNIFIRAGGRGLATAAGAALAMNPLPLALFLVMYFTGFYIIRRNVHIATVIGALGMATLLFNTPQPIIEYLQFAPLEFVSQFKVAWTAIALLVVVKNIEPIRELVGDKREADEESIKNN